MRFLAKAMVALMAPLIVGVGSVGAVHAAAAAPHSYTCHGTLANPATVPGGTYLRLTMPTRSVCLVAAPVTVLTPLWVRADAGLVVVDGSLTVDGPVWVGSRAAFGDGGGTAPINVRGPVFVGDGAAFLVGTETPGGPIISHIHGPVIADGAGTVQIHNTTVDGPVWIHGGGAANAIVSAFAGGFPTNFNDLEDNHIFGPVAMVGYHGIWGGVIRNQIHGPFVFSHNRQPVADEWDIGSNVIHGPAVCDDNSPAPNVGQSPGGPSVVYGPTLGDQAATCTGIGSTRGR